MNLSNLFIKRTKELPNDAETIGHRLMLKGGYIHQTGSGIYTYSPLGFKLIENIKNIIRKEMDNISCQEMLMPVISPLSLWKETGRENIDVLLKTKSRSGIEIAINPTHEEVVVDFARTNIQSYKQFPFCLYQIQTKYRDELRARAGLIRCREFLMKDAYSFHTNQPDFELFYNKMMTQYMKIFDELGLENVIVVEASGGDMGGKISHEFQMLSNIGEDTIYRCECKTNYNKEIIETTGNICPKCSKIMTIARGVELGNIFTLGDKYTKPMNVSYMDTDGKKQTPIMGCYGIGVSRTMAAIFEQSKDENSIWFNKKIAPFKVHIITIGDEDAISTATELYKTLNQKNIETIIDDSNDRAGSKFANADLIGAPIRIILSDRNLKNNKVEVKTSPTEIIEVEEENLIETILSILRD